MYDTTGKVDRIGKANEGRLTKQLNEDGPPPSLFPQYSADCNIKRIGGTKHKEDIQITRDEEVVYNISAKWKDSGIKCGSYDYVNTTRPFNDLPSLEGAKEEIKSIREREINQNNCIEKVREEVKTVMSKSLKNITSNDLSKMLKEHVSDKNQDFILVVSDGKDKKNYGFEYNKMPLDYAIKNHTPFIVPDGEKCSATVKFKDNAGKVHNHGIRVRVALNNGVGALIGRSKSNSNSSLTIKFQQDAVHKVVDSMAQKGALTTF